MTQRNTKLLMLTGLMLIGSSCPSFAEANYHDVARDSEGQIVRSTDGKCVRTQWMVDHDMCTQSVVSRTIIQSAQTRKAEALTQEERTVYFKFDHAELTPEALQRLTTLTEVLKSNDNVKDAKIVGYADRIGSVSYNEKLSQKRAEAVRNYLVANGYTNARVTATRWVGKSEPSTNCPAGETRSQLITCLHNDRKVEVEIEYTDHDTVSDAR